MKNMSGDTVVGKQADPVNAQLTTYGIYQWLVKNNLRLSLLFADGSNNFLKVSSNSGGIDVYVGDGGSAELHSQEGKHEYSPHASKLFLPVPTVTHILLLCLSLILLSDIGELCVRVPSSLKAGLELCGASVDISPEVVLQGVENNTTEGQTTVSGKPSFFLLHHTPRHS